MRRVAVLLCLLCLPGVCRAGTVSVEDRISRLESRVAELEKKLSEQERCIKEQELCIAGQKETITGYETRLQEMDQRLHKQVSGEVLSTDGVRIGAGATMVLQGTGNTNAGPQKKESRTDASYTADLTFEKEFDTGGSLFAHFKLGQGNGLTDDLSLYSNVNGDADDNRNLTLTELLYEQKAFGEKFAWTFGKIDPTSYFDNNTAANDETTQFLSDIFVNNPAIGFSDPAAAVRFGVYPCEWLEFDFGVFDGDADWEKVTDHPFTIGQVNVKPGLLGREGNYRFIAWRNEAGHTKWLDTEQTNEGAYGFAVSFDQKVSDALTLFARYGWQYPGVYDPGSVAAGDLVFSLEQAWSAGWQLSGKSWGREKDVLAMAIGQAIPSNDYKQADASRRAKKEGHFETYYSIRVNDHLAISPDFQYIWNPFGKDVAGDTSDICVYGIRAQMDF